jgi:nitrogen fixation/metabolism regulation signal transduction histidine kinase
VVLAFSINYFKEIIVGICILILQYYWIIKRQLINIVFQNTLGKAERLINLDLLKARILISVKPAVIIMIYPGIYQYAGISFRNREWCRFTVEAYFGGDE